MAVYSRAEWNSVITRTRDKVLECDEEADVSELVEVPANHIWTKEDVRKVMDRLRGIRGFCDDLFPFTDFEAVSNAGAVLWRQRMIDEIEEALLQECCAGECFLAIWTVEEGFELIFDGGTIQVFEGGDLPLGGSFCVQAETAEEAEILAGEQLEQEIKDFYSPLAGVTITGTSGTSHLQTPLGEIACDDCP